MVLDKVKRCSIRELVSSSLRILRHSASAESCEIRKFTERSLSVDPSFADFAIFCKNFMKQRSRNSP